MDTTSCRGAAAESHLHSPKGLAEALLCLEELLQGMQVLCPAPDQMRPDTATSCLKLARYSYVVFGKLARACTALCVQQGLIRSKYSSEKVTWRTARATEKSASVVERFIATL